MASVWPAALIQNLAQDLCDKLINKRLPVQSFFFPTEFLSQLFRDMKPRQALGQKGTSEDMPFYVRGIWSRREIERERHEGKCGAVCWEAGSHATASQAKSPPYFVCMPTLAGYA
ncbi:hypothetical protein NQZ68_019752 [Dissostichus eleginoides]|nr:hypothetical protein NQZ68_019752 [Dissostichus eleginoides]